MFIDIHEHIQSVQEHIHFLDTLTFTTLYAKQWQI